MRFTLLAFVLLFVPFGNSLIAGKSVQKKAWTYLFFIAGDEEEIDPWSRLPIRKLEQVGSDENRSFVAHADFHWDETGKVPAQGPARRYLIEKHPGAMDGKDFSTLKINSPVVWSSKSETDSAAGESLRQFLEWGIREYPAEHYALFVLGHSWGWRGIGEDYHPGVALPKLPVGPTIDYTMASLSEFKSAISAGMPTGEKLDLLVLDACNDGVTEIAYEVRDLAKAFVAAPTEMPFLSFDYSKTFSRGILSGHELAKHLVTDALPTFGRGGSQVKAEGEYPQLAIIAVDLEKLSPFWETFKALSQRLPQTNFKDLFLGEKNAQWLDSSWNVDLTELFSELAARSDDGESRRLASRLLYQLGYPDQQAAFDSHWRYYATVGATAVRIYLRADEHHVAEKALERAQAMFEYMNPQLKHVTKLWKFETTQGKGRKDSQVRVSFLWTAESLFLRPFIAGGNWGRVEIFNGEKMLSSETFTHEDGIHLNTIFPSDSPYLAKGHTFGAGRIHGLTVSLDSVVDLSVAANHHYTGGAWLSGREYYKTVEFARAFGWADLLFSGALPSSRPPFFPGRKTRYPK